MITFKFRIDARKGIKQVKGIVGRDQIEFTECHTKLWLNTIQSNVPPPGGTWNSCCDLATGTLKKSFYMTPVVRTSSYVTKAAIQQNPGASGINAIKAYVHEYGKVIRPKNPKGMLKFTVNGKVIFAKKVRIRQKSFLARSFMYTIKKLKIAKLNPRWIKC